MRRVTEKHGYRHSDDEFGDHVALQKLKVFRDTRKSDCGKRYGIIEKNLHRLINLRTLNKLQNTVNNARENTFFRAENVSVKHKREHARKRYRSAHREREKLYVRKSERKRDANAGVSKALRLRSRSFASVEKKRKNDYRRDESERENVISRVVLRLVIVADGEKNAKKHYDVSGDHGKGDISEIFISLGGAFAENKSCDYGYEQRHEKSDDEEEVGVKFAFNFHSCDLQIQNNRDERYGIADYNARKHFFETCESVFFLKPYDRERDEKRRGNREREPEGKLLNGGYHRFKRTLVESQQILHNFSFAENTAKLRHNKTPPHIARRGIPAKNKYKKIRV